MMFEMVIDLITILLDLPKRFLNLFLFIICHYWISTQNISKEGCTGSVQFRFPLNCDSEIRAFHLEKYRFFLTAGCC